MNFTWLLRVGMILNIYDLLKCINVFGLFKDIWISMMAFMLRVHVLSDNFRNTLLRTWRPLLLVWVLKGYIWEEVHLIDTVILRKLRFWVLVNERSHQTRFIQKMNKAPKVTELKYIHASNLIEISPLVWTAEHRRKTDTIPKSQVMWKETGFPTNSLK